MQKVLNQNLIRHQCYNDLHKVGLCGPGWLGAKPSTTQFAEGLHCSAFHFQSPVKPLHHPTALRVMGGGIQLLGPKKFADVGHEVLEQLVPRSERRDSGAPNWGITISFTNNSAKRIDFWSGIGNTMSVY